MEEEFTILKEEQSILKHELEEAYLELDEYDLKFETYDEVEAKARSADEKEVELEQLREEKKKTEEQMRELRKEFEAYQKKYETKVRTKAYGEKFATIEAAGLTLEDVEIRGITETEIKLRHASGFATLNSETAPLEWTKRFFLRSEEEVAKRKQDLELFLNPPPELAASVDESEPERAPSESSQRRIDKEKEREEMAALPAKVGGAIVSISGNGGEGTGFFMQDGITTFLYTSGDALDGNTRLKIVDSNGREWKKFGDLEVAKGLNLVRLAVTEPVENALTLQPQGQAPVLGEALASFQVVSGTDSLKETISRVQKVTATTYEGGVSFERLPSGSPVITSQGNVLAVLIKPITVRKNVWLEKSSVKRAKNLGARLDVPIVWEKISLGNFVGARNTMERFDRGTRLLTVLAKLRPKSEGISMTSKAGGKQTVKDVLQDNRQLSVVAQIVALDRELKERGTKTSPRDLARKFRSIYATGQRNVAEETLNASSFSSYHAGDVALSLQKRTAAQTALETAIRSLGQ